MARRLGLSGQIDRRCREYRSRRYSDKWANRACANIGDVLESQLCKLSSLTSPELLAWSDRLRSTWDPDRTDPKPLIVHRKMWEWLFICQALFERGMLQPGRRGLGFGVGREPLVALFASLGCTVTATDLDPDRARQAGWTDSGVEYAGDLPGLNEHGLCAPEDFKARVSYRNVSMDELPDDLGTFDFTWSSCALEHLGNLEAGLEFVVGQMRYLVPGGVSVHTTEFNVSSDTATVAQGGTVLYRRRDIEGLVSRLRKMGHGIVVDFSEGETPSDQHVDVAPFTDTHLRTELAGYVTTSIGLIIEKDRSNTAGSSRRWGRRGHRLSSAR